MASVSWNEMDYMNDAPEVRVVGNKHDQIRQGPPRPGTEGEEFLFQYPCMELGIGRKAERPPIPLLYTGGVNEFIKQYGHRIMPSEKCPWLEDMMHLDRPYKGAATITYDDAKTLAQAMYASATCVGTGISEGGTNNGYLFYVAETGEKFLISAIGEGVWDTYRQYLAGDRPRLKHAFITRDFGEQEPRKSWWQRVHEWLKRRIHGNRG